MGEGQNMSGLSRKHIMQACEASLRRLGVETIDLYQVHGFDPLTPLEETLRFLDDAVRAGKIHYVGLSNFTGWQVQKTVDLADAWKVTRPVTLQPQYNLLTRETEWEIVAACQAGGLGLLPWSPLAGGWLTGKYTRDERPAGATRLGEDPERQFQAYDRRGRLEQTWQVLGEVRAVAAERGVSMAAVSLAWLVDRPGVSSVILGARTVEQLNENLKAAGLHLTPGETPVHAAARSAFGLRRKAASAMAGGSQPASAELTSRPGSTISSIRSSVASSSSSDAPATVSRSSSTVCTSMIAAVTAGCATVNAIARWASETPCSSASRAYSRTRSTLSW
jgi:aryl-alcohol dehydrogenase-like predicted oxidoreductase